MKYKPRNRHLNISTSNTMKAKNNHSFFKSTFKLSALRFNFKRNICCLRSDKEVTYSKAWKWLFDFSSGFVCSHVVSRKQRKLFQTIKQKLKTSSRPFRPVVTRKKYKLKLIKFTSSARPTNLVFSIDIIKSKKGSKPALYPGEFSCT